MASSLGPVFALGLIACTYTAPESVRPILQEIVATASLTDSSPDIKPADIAVNDPTIDISDEDTSEAGAEKSSGLAAVKTGGLDRGLVSDVIESTLSGVHLGFAIGSNNGTIDRLCIKLGNITMAGCRRAAPHEKKVSSDGHITELKSGKNAMYDLTITLPID